jgi:hypothetical protein
MGGLVNTSIKFKDGSKKNTLIYTSQLLDVFSSTEFFNKDKEGLLKILEQYPSNDYSDKNITNEEPYQYGIVIADFTNDILLDYQYYCSIGKIFAFEIDRFKNFEDFEIYLKKIKKLEIENSELSILFKLFNEKRIIKYRKNYEPVDINFDYNLIKTSQDLFKFLNEEKINVLYYDLAIKTIKIPENNSKNLKINKQKLNY